MPRSGARRAPARLPGASARAWVDSADGVGFRARERAADVPSAGSGGRVPAAVAVSPPPPAHVRRDGRPGAGRAHAAQRGEQRQGAPRLPVRRAARHGQDLDGEDPRGVPELRARADDRAMRAVRIVQIDRERELARRDRDGRRVEQLGRRHPRPARERRLRARVGTAQGVHPRRGAHALDGRLERLPEDARGAAAEHRVRARDDRGPEGAGDGRRPLPPLRLPPPDGRADRERRARAPRRSSRSRSRPRRSPRSPARRRAASATRWARSSSWSPTAAREIALADVLAVLGVADARAAGETVDAVAAGDARRGAAGAGASAPSRGATRAPSPPTWRRARASCSSCRRSARSPTSCRSRPRPTRALLAQAQRVDHATVVALLELLAGAMEAVRAGADPRTRLELALVKAAEPRLDGSTRALLARIERLEAAGGLPAQGTGERRAAAPASRPRRAPPRRRPRAPVAPAAPWRGPATMMGGRRRRPRCRAARDAAVAPAGPPDLESLCAAVAERGRARERRARAVRGGDRRRATGRRWTART